MKRIWPPIVFIIIMLAILANVSSALPAASPNAPGAVSISLPGVPNLYKVDDHIYRSAQPTPEGMKNIEKRLGIKTVINLRSYNSNQDEIKGTGLKEIRVKMQAWNPDRQELIRVLRQLRDPENAPYLVHCQHGADRTGMVIAMYRMTVQDWKREDAIEEMRNGGYGFHELWTDIVKFLETVDIEEIKEAL